MTFENAPYQNLRWCIGETFLFGYLYEECGGEFKTPSTFMFGANVLHITEDNPAKNINEQFYSEPPPDEFEMRKPIRVVAEFRDNAEVCETGLIRVPVVELLHHQQVVAKFVLEEKLNDDGEQIYIVKRIFVDDKKIVFLQMLVDDGVVTESCCAPRAV